MHLAATQRYLVCTASMLCAITTQAPKASLFSQFICACSAVSPSFRQHSPLLRTSFWNCLPDRETTIGAAGRIESQLCRQTLGKTRDYSPQDGTSNVTSLLAKQHNSWLSLLMRLREALKRDRAGLEIPNLGVHAGRLFRVAEPGLERVDADADWGPLCCKRFDHVCHCAFGAV